MAAQIKVLIADDIQATRENIKKLISFHPEIIIAGEAETAEEAIAIAKEIQPDIILMDVNMPGMDGIKATGLLSTEMPQSSIIIMSVQAEQEYLRRAMNAGAKDYLTKPFTGDELLQAIKLVYTTEQQRRKVVLLGPKLQETGIVTTVFSAKGGIGKTTIATNLAVAIAAKTRQQVCIVDADLQFGDVSLFLNVLPRATSADLINDIDNLDEKLIAGYLTKYNDFVDVLAAPLKPEQAETITASHFSAILKVLRTMYQHIIIDTAPSFSEPILTALDEADHIVVVASLDLPAIKNIKVCLEIMESLSYNREKIKLVLNRAYSEGGMDIQEVEESLRYPFIASFPSDGKTVVPSVNRGIPFVVSNPDAQISQSIFALAKSIASDDWLQQEKSRGMVFKLKKKLLG